MRKTTNAPAAKATNKPEAPAGYQSTSHQRGGAKKSADAAKKVSEMFEVVKFEIESNKGVYPLGRLSVRGFAKRADVDLSTLYTVKGKVAGQPVRDFIKAYNEPKEGETAIPCRRRTVHERLQDKTLEYEVLLQQHQIRHLHLQQTKAERDEAQDKVRELTIRLSELEARLAAGAKVSASTVVPAKTASKKGARASTGSEKAKVLPFRATRDKPAPSRA